MYCVSRVTLEKRSSNAAQIVATRQEVLLDPRVEACYTVGIMGTRIHAFLERYFTHHGRLYLGFSYIIMLHRVSLMFGLCRVFLYSTTT
jgi:hypothetical protein